MKLLIPFLLVYNIIPFSALFDLRNIPLQNLSIVIPDELKQLAIIPDALIKVPIVPEELKKDIQNLSRIPELREDLKKLPIIPEGLKKGIHNISSIPEELKKLGIIPDDIKKIPSIPEGLKKLVEFSKLTFPTGLKKIEEMGKLPVPPGIKKIEDLRKHPVQLGLKQIEGIRNLHIPDGMNLLLRMSCPFPNQIRRMAGGCPETCQSYSPMICTNINLNPLKTTCGCIKGYILDEITHKCVIRSECPKIENKSFNLFG